MSSVANGDFDDILNDIAKALYRNSDINDLGKALGFGPAEIGRKVEENAKQGGNYMGTLQLLRMWRKRQTPLTEKAALRSVLLKAGFDNLADQYLSTPVLGEHGEMPDQVQRLREKLNARYIEEFSEVKVSPMDSTSRTWLQQIFVSLILTLGYNKYQGQPLEYEDLFSFIQTKTDKGFITRVAFLGEAGVGKSTLFAKIALDWAMGKCLQDITLLFHETFRDIEDSPFFGNIVMNHFQDDTEIKGEWIDEYIKENQRKVLILLDGLDEAKMDIKCPNSELAIVLMARREKFIDTSVLISTRPFGAEQIISIPKINEKYSYIQVKGFTKENTNKYIKQFFGNDTASASSLIHFMNTNSVASQLMAPFPIFCSMLCYMWKVESKRETTEKLRAVSQLMKEIDFTLREQYSSRYTDNEEGYQSHMVEAAEAIVKVGSVAFEGLLKNQLIFTKEEMEACDKAAAIACQVGILRREKMTASRKIRQREGKQFIQEFCFPHKLLQEHIASLYLAWLYNHNRSEFNRILTHNLIKDYMAFRYVLYFTAAHGGEVGKSVLEALCKNPDNIRFIIEVAFECHDSEAINPVWNLLKTETNLSLNDDIPITAYLYTLETIGREVVRRSPLISETLGVSKSFEAYATSSHVAVAIFTLQNLRWLEINSKLLDDRFYLGMYPAASKSKIEKLEHRHVDLGSAASSHYARGLCSMPDLRSLVLYDVKLTDEFYSTLASEASKSKIEKLEHWSADLGSAISSHYARGLCFMPNLRSLRLSMKLSDEFYSTMASESSKSKIEKLVHCNADLGSTASSHYARGLCSMPNLRSLLLYGMKLSDEFYSTMASEASKLKIEELDHWSADLGSAAASFHYARGLCFMPNLRSLSLYNMKLSDEFYSTLASEASKSKIEKLEHQCVDLGSAASSHYARGLCFMPHLRSLDLSYEKLSDEFYSTMASEASKSKIERIVDKSADLGSAASSHYARGLCFMPNLRSLRLYDVKLSDEFYSTMASEASKSKIQTLSIVSVSMMTPRRLHSILSLPRLQSLTLMEIGKIDMDDGETLIGQITSVDELRVDGRHVESLWKLGLDTSCPLVKKLELNWMDLEDVSLDTVLMACSPFHHLTHLHFDGSATLKYPDLFCDAIKISCPQLTKLSITHIGLCKKAAEIIQLMKTHPHLTSIELNKCGTNPDLDPLISEVNSEGKLTVTVRD